MSRNDDCTAEILLDFSYHQNYCKLVGINLSRQKNTNISQQINFLGKLEDDSGTMFFIAEKQHQICDKVIEHYQ